MCAAPHGLRAHARPRCSGSPTTSERRPALHRGRRGDDGRPRPRGRTPAVAHGRSTRRRPPRPAVPVADDGPVVHPPPVGRRSPDGQVPRPDPPAALRPAPTSAPTTGHHDRNPEADPQAHADAPAGPTTAGPTVVAARTVASRRRHHRARPDAHRFVRPGQGRRRPVVGRGRADRPANYPVHLAIPVSLSGGTADLQVTLTIVGLNKFATTATRRGPLVVHGHHADGRSGQELRVIRCDLSDASPGDPLTVGLDIGYAGSGVGRGRAGGARTGRRLRTATTPARRRSRPELTRLRRLRPAGTGCSWPT